MRIKQSWFGDLFTVTVLFLFTGAFITVLIGDSTAEDYLRGSSKMQAIWSTIYFVTLLRAFPIRHRILAALKQNYALVGLLLVTSLSFMWSIDPQLTAHRSIALCLGTIFATDFAVRHAVKKQIQLVTVVLAIAVLASAFVELILPGIVPSAPTGYKNYEVPGWNGLFNHKNAFGHFLAFSVLCTLVRSEVSLLKRAAKLVVISLLFTLILASQSRTALVISVLLLLQWPLLRVLQWDRRSKSTLGAALLLATVSLLVAAAALNASIASTIGRTTELSGRTDIWRMTLQSAAKRFVLGYGYDGYFGMTYDSNRMSDLLGWRVPSAHNGFLEVYIQVGLVGLSLLGIVIVTGIVRAARLAGAVQTRESLWPLASILLIVFYATTESYFLTSNSFTWTIFVSALVNVNEYRALACTQALHKESRNSTVQRKEDVTYA